MASGETPRFLQAIELGVGAWQWGDKVIWNYGRGYTEADIRAAFDVSINQGVTLIDTAEIYAMGKSERFVGKFAKATEQPVLVATKFFPFPWRFGRKSVISALKRSLERLGLDSVALYQVHWPPVIGTIEALMDGMADAVEMGLTRAVGVSNFSQSQMMAAYSALARRGLSLGSNQLEYNLLDRRIEKNGLLQRCKELGVRVVAYSPLGQGLLTGKYSSQNPPPGLRARQYGHLLGKISPLIKLMTGIGQDVGGKSPAQVALNWCLCKGTLAIPGAKTAEQAEMNAGSTGWRLTSEQIAALDEASDQIIR
jgi:aryl-alcohol dehydrogenase-like predicted oxidoreductase